MRPLAATLAVLLAGLLSLGPARAAPLLLPTNLPGAYTVAAPPPGFDPMHASIEALEDYGFPRRPDPADRLFPEWSRAMRAARVRLVPVLQPTTHAAGRALRLARGAGGPATSRNWSGMVIGNYATSFGPASFTRAAGFFNIPTANQAFGTCNPAGVHLYTWAGIDGWYNDEVFQAGTESSAYCTNGVVSRYYFAWYEWYPHLAVNITNLPVRAGDVMAVYVSATSSTTGWALVENETTNQYVVVYFSAPPGVSLVGNSAEWIEERPYWNGVLSTLTNYVTAWMTGTGAYLNGWYDWGSPPPGNVAFPVTMLDNAGAPISLPSGLWFNGLVVEDVGSVK